jgi:hypothetical protein
MSPRQISFEVPVKLNSQASLAGLADPTRKIIFAKLGIKTIEYGDRANPLDLIPQFDERLVTIFAKCEEFATSKNTITLIVSVIGGWTLKEARSNILKSLFIECKEAKLARQLQDIIDDLKEAKRKADIAAQVAREKKIVEAALKVILFRLSMSNYCEIYATFNKATNAFDVSFIDREPAHFSGFERGRISLGA